jgi:hypothetical protein
MDIDMYGSSSRESSSSSGGALYGDITWTESEWWLNWVPGYVQEFVRNSPFLLSISTNYASRLRFVESVLFVVIVLIIILQSALPALYV